MTESEELVTINISIPAIPGAVIYDFFVAGTDDTEEPLRRTLRDRLRHRTRTQTVAGRPATPIMSIDVRTGETTDHGNLTFGYASLADDS